MGTAHEAADQSSPVPVIIGRTYATQIFVPKYVFHLLSSNYHLTNRGQQLPQEPQKTLTPPTTERTKKTTTQKAK